jgi:hypothetical protein
MMSCLLWSALVVLTPAADATEKFRDIEIEKPYDTYLRGNRLLMELAGAKIIRLRDGNRMLLAVGSTVLADNKPRTRLDAEKVCRAKALANLVAEKQGVQVARVEKIEDRTVVVIEDGKEKARSVAQVLEITKTQVRGLAPGLAIVGRWKSKDGQVFYLALGMICNSKGERVETNGK